VILIQLARAMRSFCFCRYQLRQFEDICQTYILNYKFLAYFVAEICLGSYSFEFSFNGIFGIVDAAF